MNNGVFKTFLAQLVEPQLSHRIGHIAGVPCALFCNLIVAKPVGLEKF